MPFRGINAASLAAAAAVLTINAAAAFVLLLFLLIAMNGYSEGDAAYGLALYIFLSASVAISSTILAVAFARRLRERGRSLFLSGVFAAGVFSFAGILVDVLAAIAAVLVAEIVRTTF